MSVMLTFPVTPKSNAIPKRSNGPAIFPSMMYLSAVS